MAKTLSISDFEAAVFWDRVDIDYISEGKLLEQVILNRLFGIEKLDKCADFIKKEFIDRPWEELEPVHIKLLTKQPKYCIIKE